MALLSLATTACGLPFEYTTEIRVRDPTAVAVLASPPSAASADAIRLPEGGAPATTALPPRTVATGPDSSATYRLELARDPGGGVTLHADTSLPVSTGDNYRVLGADGRVVPLKTDDYPGPLPGFGPPVFTQPMCANSTRHTHRYGAADYRITIDPRCTLDSLERIELVTPRENVVEVRRTRAIPGSYRTLAGIMLFSGLTPLLLGGGIYLMVAMPDHRVGYGVGIPLTALGALLASYKLRVIFTPDESQVVHP